MRKLYYSKRETCISVWQIISAVALTFGIFMSVLVFLLKKKNNEYRNVIIDMSDDFSDDELEACRRREEWRKNHSRQNRQPVEKQLEERRVDEEV